MKKIKIRRRYRKGVSLMEMVLSLTIFATVIFPMMAIMTQALDL